MIIPQVLRENCQVQLKDIQQPHPEDITSYIKNATTLIMRLMMSLLASIRENIN